jgi:hypothetical protein
MKRPSLAKIKSINANAVLSSTSRLEAEIAELERDVSSLLEILCIFLQAGVKLASSL